MNLEITGKLIEKYETQVVSERFKKREFVLELVEEVNGSPYTNYAKMQLVQNKCDILDRFNVGETLRVNFNIKGNRYEKEGRTSYFSNLDAWRLEKADANTQATNPAGSYNQGNNPGGNFNTGGNFNNNNGAQGGGNWGGTGGNTNGNFQTSNTHGQNSPNADTSDDLPF